MPVAGGLSSFYLDAPGSIVGISKPGVLVKSNSMANNCNKISHDK